MPNLVVSFEVRGPDPELLHAFYRDVFGWDVYVYPGGGYAGLDTSPHVHDENTGATTYTGPDAFMNEGIETNEDAGHLGWRYKGETSWREFAPGVSGGIGRGPRGVSFYIQVPDLAAALKTIEAHGGATTMPPTEVAPQVTVAGFRDPAGNELNLVLRVD